MHFQIFVEFAGLATLLSDITPTMVYIYIYISSLCAEVNLLHSSMIGNYNKVNFISVYIHISGTDDAINK